MTSDIIASACLSIWKELEASGKLKFIKDPLYTIMAGIALIHGDEVQCVAIGSGSKCLAQSQLSSLNGDCLHDSHAEILARRGMIVWLLSEMQKMKADHSYRSRWLENRNQDTTGVKFKLREGVMVHMYVSSLPCAPFLQSRWARCAMND